MTKNQLQPLGLDDRMKLLIQQQLKDAEANLAFTEEQYLRAKREHAIARETYERHCTNDPESFVKRRKVQ